MKKIYLTALVLAAAALLSLPLAAQANLLTDGGFNNSDLGATAWTNHYGANWTQNTEVHEGSYALGQKSGEVWQEFVVSSPGAGYVLEIYRKTASDFPTWGDTQLNLEWYDAADNTIGSIIENKVSGAISDWTLHGYTEMAPLNAAKGRLWVETWGDKDAFADAASVDVVPEPASMLLLGSGLLGLLGISRKKKVK